MTSKLKRAFVAMGDYMVAVVRRHTRAKGEDSRFFHGLLSPGVREKALELAVGEVSSAGANAIEVGCGDGLFAIPLAERWDGMVVGLELLDEPLKDAICRKQAAGLNNLSFARGLAQSLPFKDASFDVVVSVNTLNSLPTADEVQCAIAEMARISRRTIVLDIRNSYNPIMRYRFRWRTLKHHGSQLVQLTFSRKEIAKMFEKCGFHIEEARAVGFPFSLIAPAVVLRASRYK